MHTGTAPSTLLVDDCVCKEDLLEVGHPGGRLGLRGTRQHEHGLVLHDLEGEGVGFGGGLLQGGDAVQHEGGSVAAGAPCRLIDTHVHPCTDGTRGQVRHLGHHYPSPLPCLQATESS